MDYGLPKFTVEQYLAYIKAPQWQLDGKDSAGEYHAYTCSMVKDMYDESDEAFQTERTIWKACYDQLDASNKRGITAASVAEDMVAAMRIPILKNTALDDVASLYAGNYQPVLKALQKPMQQMIGLANRFMKIEFILNNFDTLKFNLGLDGFVTDLWILKLTTDDSDPGPFGERERIVMERIDPLKCYPDPKANRIFWPEMDYFGVAQEFDIGVVKSRFRDQADLIDETLCSTDEGYDSKKWAASQLLVLPGSRRRWSGGAERRRVQLKEWWIHDTRLKFRAYKEVGLDGKPRVSVDENGYVEGTWEPAYPAGRMIITAADKLVLRDIPNPYWHNELPFVICSQNPTSGRVFNVGKAASVLGIDRKINDFETRIHSYGQSEIERPMEADVGTFPTKLDYYKTTGQSRRIIVKYQGKNFIRRAAVEPPVFVDAYIARMERYLGKTIGQNSILQGDPTGSGVTSAQAMQGAQGASTTRISMQSTYIAAAHREIGRKFFYLQKETYKTGLSAQVMGPNGPEMVYWDARTATSDWYVDIDLMSSNQGNKIAAGNQAVDLYDKGLVDAPYVYPILGIENWEEMYGRIKKDKLEKIESQAYGRSMGTSIKQFEKQNEQRGAPAKAAS